MYLRNIRSRNVYTPRRNFRALFDRKINGVFTYRRKERSLFLHENSNLRIFPSYSDRKYGRR